MLLRRSAIPRVVLKLRVVPDNVFSQMLFNLLFAFSELLNRPQQCLCGLRVLHDLFYYLKMMALS